MKVLCISDEHCYNEPKPIVGEPYTVKATHLLVAGEMGCNHPGGLFYELYEISICYYYHTLFAPISDVDETEMIREYNFKTQPV